jgi:poly(A) polymerase
MIKKLITKLFNKPKAAKSVLGQRVEVPVSEHGIDVKLLDERAVRVVETLQQGGYEAYVVGGAVRDLLLGRRPKDFDVATNATPEQVKSLFRRAFIIGRRFRIVHVVFGRGREHEVVEVSTFRALLVEGDADRVSGNEKTSKKEMADKAHVVDASGRVLRDNVWGPQVEDAARRDFTVNAMYYDPARELLVDYHGGLADLRAKLLRMIGDPETRYREDPVRILRAVRFAAKLGFTVEPASKAPLQTCAKLLAEVPISRTFDEMIKLLQTGHGLASLEQLKAQGLGRGLFPVLDAVLQPDGSLPAGWHGELIRLALNDTDARVAEGRSVSPSFLLACLLWGEVKQRWSAIRAQGEPTVPALQQAIDQVFDARIGDISGRGKLAADMREIWLMQPRFERRGGSGPFSLVEQPRYRAGFDFLRLRADAGDAEPALADWWEDFALGSDEDRSALVEEAKTAERSQPRAEGAADPAKKRRRRRRPAKKGGGDAPAPAGE